MGVPTTKVTEVLILDSAGMECGGRDEATLLSMHPTQTFMHSMLAN